MTAMPGKGRMAAWHVRALAVGLRPVLVWVPDGGQPEIRALAQQMRNQAGALMARDASSSEFRPARVAIRASSTSPIGRARRVSLSDDSPDLLSLMGAPR